MTKSVKRTASFTQKKSKTRLSQNCVRQICNLTFKTETKRGREKIKPSFVELKGNDKCQEVYDLEIKSCSNGETIELKSTFLGEGGYARVFPIKGNNSQIMRITRAWEDRSENSFKTEKQGIKFIQMLNKKDIFDTMNIVKIHKYGIYKLMFERTPVYGIYTLQDNYTGGDLHDLQNKFKNEIREYPIFMYKIMKDLAQAVSFMHKNRICNRDIKPENVMIVSPISSLKQVPKIRVIDFGLAARVNSDGKYPKDERKVGTKAFQSPEILRREQYGVLTDVWSLGVTFYDVYRFTLPFDPMFESDEQITDLNYGSMVEHDPELHKLLQKMFRLQDTRISSKDVLSELLRIYKSHTSKLPKTKRSTWV